MTIYRETVVNIALILILVSAVGIPAFPDYIEHINRICSAKDFTYGPLRNNHYIFLNDIGHLFDAETICSTRDYYVSNVSPTPLLGGRPETKSSAIFFLDFSRMILASIYYMLAYGCIKIIQAVSKERVSYMSSVLISTPPFMLMLISPSSDSFVAVVSLLTVFLIYTSRYKESIVVAIFAIFIVKDKSLVVLVAYTITYYIFYIFNAHRLLKKVSFHNLAMLLILAVVFGNVFSKVIIYYLDLVSHVVGYLNTDIKNAYLSTKNFGDLYFLGFFASIFASTDMRLINIFLLLYFFYCFLLSIKIRRKVDVEKESFYYNSFFIGFFLFSLSSSIVGGTSMARHHIYLYVILFIYLYNLVHPRCIKRIKIPNYLFYLMYILYSYSLFSYV